MNILDVARKLRPNTAWNLRGDVLEQALDESPRVSVPTKQEIDEYLAANPEEKVPSLHEQLKAIWIGGTEFAEVQKKMRKVLGERENGN